MESTATRRKATNVALDPQLVANAREEGINLSRACEAGLADALKKAREARWLAENRDAIAAWNVWMEEHELPLAQYRQI